MATAFFEVYIGAGPTWTALGANRLVFSGSPTDLTADIVAGEFQDGTHAGDGTPGTDQCGANHANNVKYVSDTEMSVNGGATVNVDDANITDDECTLRIRFTHPSAVAITNARLFIYDDVAEANYAKYATLYAFERGVGATAWTKVNDGDNKYGGDTVGQVLSLSDKPAATEHTWYVALSFSPEIDGLFPNLAVGLGLTYE